MSGADDWMRISFQDAFTAVAAMADEILPARASSYATKAAHEAREFAETPVVEEAVDVLIAVLAWAHRTGVSVQQLSDAIVAKVTANYERTWILQPDGTYQHDGEALRQP
jgi:hypothetical protein